jgi:hypothetical protein
MKLSTALPQNQRVLGNRPTASVTSGSSVPKDGFQASHFDGESLRRAFSSTAMGLTAGGVSLVPLAGAGVSGALAGCLATEAVSKLMGSEASSSLKMAGGAVGGLTGAVLSAVAVAEVVQGNCLPLAALAVGTAAITGVSHWISES